MFCIKCFHDTTRVTNSRPHKKQPSVWRRRTCPHCNATFTTLEQPSLDGTPVHNNNHAASFNIGILTISIAASFQHDVARGQEHAYWLARTVERWLATEHTHITTHDIEAVTHQTLERFDHLAATQYAARHQLLS